MQLQFRESGVQGTGESGRLVLVARTRLLGLRFHCSEMVLDMGHMPYE